MVNLSLWSQQPCGRSPRAALLCRGAKPLPRSTTVRCFKDNSDVNGSKQSTSVRLNFRIPYRVSYGQSLALVGSGDALGNWDPKRTVQMKWTDGDWWTVELHMAPGCSLDLEYKYVVVNPDGNVSYWKPGSNFRVTLPLPSSGSKVPKRIKVADAWDDSYKKVDVEEAELPPSVSISGDTTEVAQSTAKPAAQPAPAQRPIERPQQPPSSALVAEPFVPPAAAAQSTAPAPQPVYSASTAWEAPQPSSNGASAKPPPATPVAEPAARQATASIPPTPLEQASSTGQPQTTPHAASPRTPAPGPSAVASLPVLNQLAAQEEERLEDGVRNSLEDLRNEIDNHQQLREKTKEAKLAAAEAMTARLADMVEALTKEVASLRSQLSAVQGLLMTACQLLTALLRMPSPPRQDITQQFFLTPGHASGIDTGSFQAAVPLPWDTPAAATEGGVQQLMPLLAVLSAQQPSQHVAPVAAKTDATVGASGSGPAEQGESRGSATPENHEAREHAVTAAPRAGTKRVVRTPAQQRVAPLRASGPTATQSKLAVAAEAGGSLGPSLELPKERRQLAVRVRSTAKAANKPTRAVPVVAVAPHTVPVALPSAVMSPLKGPVPVICGVGRGAADGARGEFDAVVFRADAGVRGKGLGTCIKLLALKRQGAWVELASPRFVTPLEFVQEAGLRGKNWKASIRLFVDGVLGQPIGQYLEQQGSS